jgi:hypothetical protein
MSLLASEFGGKYGFCIGCSVLVLYPIFCALWIGLQVRGLLMADRMSLVWLVLILCFAPLPGYVMVFTWPMREVLRGYVALVFFLTLGGLALLPVTLTRELLKVVRDWPRSPRKRRSGKRRAQSPDDEPDAPEV